MEQLENKQDCFMVLVHCAEVTVGQVLCSFLPEWLYNIALQNYYPGLS